MTIQSEIAEIPERARDAIAEGASAARALSPLFRDAPPHTLLTLARGSSGAAAAYARALAAAMLGLPGGVLDAASPAFFGAELRFERAWLVSISQSGRSPDLIDTLAAFNRSGGAGCRSIAVVNDAGAPLAGEADAGIDMRAGAERSVAATKSVICSMTLMARLIAGLAEDDALIGAIEALPDVLAQEAESPQAEPLTAALRDQARAFTLGRAFTAGAAEEAALKLKETCLIHAEMLDSAEIMHGPKALIEPGFPIVAFRPDGALKAPFEEAVRQLAGLGARVVSMDIDLSDGGPACHPAVLPIRQLARFYTALPALAAARGLDADAPRHLTKVTQTA